MTRPPPRASVMLAGLLAGMVVAAPAARAWNGTGHEAAALVAWDQLSPDQRRAVTDALKGHPLYQRDLAKNLEPADDADRHAFLEAATWPDFVRSLDHPLNRTENHPVWHYVDYPYDRDGKAGPAPVEQWDGHSDPANLLQAMQKVTAEIRDPKTPADRRAIDYCWVMHLVGDVHQPLHAVSLYSDKYPDGDKGGNSIVLKTATNNVNLHAIWDGLEGFSPHNPTYDPPFDVIRKVADRVERDHPPGQFADRLARTDPKDWAAESFALAKTAVYRDGKLSGALPKDAKDHPDDVPPEPVNYERDAHAVADEQVALAGYRLADELRTLLAATPATRPSATTRLTPEHP